MRGLPEASRAANIRSPTASRDLPHREPLCSSTLVEAPHRESSALQYGSGQAE
jgi:hypothetical protein